ncbi:MAG: nonstructural protein [Microvirus sp.]|nr:MAG: nonstructural protein [Microvirus sp.]
MNINVYSIFDHKAGIYSQPFYAINADVAARMFADLANDKSTSIGKHPADFTLTGLGVFDDGLGRFDNFDHPEHLMNAVQLVERANDEK